jgi:NADH dehydrogenase
MNSPGAKSIPHVVIVGGGFGGLSAGKALRKQPIHLTLIDRTNHHTFQPLLYQVAMAGLSPSDIAWPIRSILSKNKNAKVLLAEVDSIDLKNQTVHLRDNDSIHYDYLVLGTGGRTSYFGHNEWEQFAPGLKTLEDATEIRRRVLLAFEEAERVKDPKRHEELLTFVVIGGGPTGVELAGALAELSHTVLARDFCTIDPSSARVLLIEGGPRLLPAFAEDLSVKAKKQLEDLGAMVKLNARVTMIDKQGVHLGDELIRSGTVIWGAGVIATDLTATLGVPLDKSGRVIVEPDLTIPGFKNAFAIGDTTNFSHQGGTPLPGLSPVAMQMGKSAGENIIRAMNDERYEIFHYTDKGTMATIGRSAAIAQFGRIHLSGFLAWMSWLVVHIFFLIGFRNRLVVMFNWAWSYITYQRGARLITNLVWSPSESPAKSAVPAASKDIGEKIAR